MDKQILEELANQAYLQLRTYGELNRITFVNIIISRLGHSAYTTGVLINDDKGYNRICKKLLDIFKVLRNNEYIYANSRNCWVKKHY